MKKLIRQMTEITVDELQQYFEDYLDRVGEGETFLIKSVNGDCVLMPIDEYEDMVRICSGFTD
jgi:prevent-host-death family protein